MAADIKNPLFYPAESPQVNRNEYTVDTFLKEPTRISRYISDLAAVGLFTNKLFSTVSTQSGSLLYDVLTENDLFADDDLGVIAPGAAFPLLGVSSDAPRVKRTEKIGGAFAITDEARRRNDTAIIERSARKIANTMTRDIDRIGVATIKDAITEFDSQMVKIDSDGWVKKNSTKSAEQTALSTIRADINKALVEGEKLQLGYKYNLLLMHPDDYLQFANHFGDDVAQQNFVAARGVQIVTTPQLTAGEAWLAAGGQLGVMGVEKGISTNTYREHAYQREVVQTDALFAFAVTDPMALVRIRNLQGA